jgi:hypothetical protein
MSPFGSKREESRKADEARAARDATPEVHWEYLARNLQKVAGMALEDDFNKHGEKGWEFVAVARDYAIFKRPIR